MMEKQAPLSQVNVIGMEIDSSSNPSRLGMGGSSTGNSSQCSFTSLAPPVLPAPVPPLRPPRKPSHKTHTTSRHDTSDSADSNIAINWAQVTVESGSPQTQHQLAPSEASLARSDAFRSSIPGAGTSTVATSLDMDAASTVATSVSPATSTQALPPWASASKEADIGHDTFRNLALSPAPTMSRRLSEISDAGTKEILLSDRESLAAPKISSESFVRGPIDEQHPDLQTFYPAGTSLARPIKLALSAATSPPSLMSEEVVGSGLPRHVGAVPDLSSSRASSSHDGILGRMAFPHVQNSQLTEASRYFRSVRSYRSTSDGSVRQYRPLPSVPVQSRGYSLDPAVGRRDISQADSIVTVDADSVPDNIGQRGVGNIDGLPTLDAHLSPLMPMGMVTAASSPTQWTHSSPEQPVKGASMYDRRSSRSSLSKTSPVGGPRPFPSISAQSLDAAIESASNRHFVANGKEGPPLSPSASYDVRPQSQVLKLPFKSHAGPRDSWNSFEEPWSAAVVTSSSVLGAVRGMARPELTVNDNQLLRRALSQPQDDVCGSFDGQILSPSRPDEDEDAELTRLEKSRSGTKILPPLRVQQSNEPSSSVERAPYADTGVQASLAALRALESPGESLRTILARQRIFGEDAAVTEFLRESRILNSESHLDDQEGLVMNGPHQRRRSAPHPRDKTSCYSSEELSSTGKSPSDRRADAARRRRRANNTSQADGSGASRTETSGRRQRSRSDNHASGTRNSMPSNPAGHHGANPSRYDAQLEDLLLLREKAMQFESSTGHDHGRSDSQNASIDHGRTVSMQGGYSYSTADSARRPRKSSTSSKRKSRSCKLGYTLPDILAWQEGLGNNAAASPKVV
ncbi:uncharacterized protein UTRI_03562_B [Ustilago trichophora]|uniref:Uncharacterized protein n=1 Tax=Ustilago trichophora TaxID=86804 RepID=A0A5C3E0P4_9BASI|nr:uncharacterized protein UTRI_03562_B [Ustilago trichophora]